jgi:hypothetical protein
LKGKITNKKKSLQGTEEERGRDSKHNLSNVLPFPPHKFGGKERTIN